VNHEIKLLLILCIISGCNTVIGTVEGTTVGVIKDVKTIHHYSICVFTKIQCGNLDLGE